MKSKVPSFTSLPEEIIENILARISRVYYPKLSLVCKSFHSLLSSTNIYKTRSQIGTTETCLYVCLKTKNNREWFTFQAKPSRTKTKTKLHKLKSSGHVLVTIPSSSCHSPPVWCSSIIAVAVGWEIYFIGGSFCHRSSSAVRILDCRSHTWRGSPSMKVARYQACAVSLDNKIYVLGGCESKHSADWVEVFDMKTQSWTSLPSPPTLENYSMVNVVQGKLHAVADKKDYMYDPKQGTWEVVSEPSISRSLSIGKEGSCVVENVLYCCNYHGDCLWYESECGNWKMVKGLEKLRENRKCGFSRSGSSAFDLVNFGGNILLVWVYKHHLAEKALWCAEISLERRCKESEVWGNVEWANAMHTAPCMSDHFEHSLVVSF